MDSLPFEQAESQRRVDKLWKEQFPGPITDLALAGQSGMVLASSIPDPEAGGKHWLTLLDRKGKQKFQIQMKKPVKNIDISNDGNWILVLHHEGGWESYDPQGQKVWDKAKATCKPIILKTKPIAFCYHDDDTKPGVVFEVFSNEGNRLHLEKSDSDALGFKISNDENWIAYSLEKGVLKLLNSKYKTVREFKVKGEILDFAVSSGENPFITLIEMNPGKKQQVHFYDFKGKKLGTVNSESHIEQIELTPAGLKTVVYGNSPQGQYIAMYNTQTSELLWQKKDKHYADFSLSIRVFENQILAGFEDVGARTRKSRLLMLGMDGKYDADLPLETKEGAYLYSFIYSPDTSLIAVGTDDKTLKLFELK